MVINNAHYLSAITTVISVFKNTTDFPVIFKSFQDDNNQPIETKNLKPGESFTSTVNTTQTIIYDIQPNIPTLSYPFMINGAYNIVFNTPTHPYRFSLIKGSFTNPDPSSQNAILATTQITNNTTFPINATIILKGMGQSAANLNAPYPAMGTTKQKNDGFTQAINTTKLPINGFYAITDTIEKLTISSALQGYSSGKLSPFSIKKQYDIVNHYGSIKIYTNN